MSFKIEQWDRKSWVLLAGLSLFVWMLYLRTMSPAFPANDSPETIAAGFELGIQHPPGYPLHALLSRLAIKAWGLGSAAWRCSLLSAGLGLISGLLACGLAWRLGAAPVLAMAALPALCLWRVSWEQATEAKGGIYLLNLALSLGLIWSALAATRRSSRIWALLAGLAMANHYLSALLILAPTGAHLWRKGRFNAWLALPGLSLYAVLMLRSRFDPALDLGNPETPAGLWWVLMRKGYTQAQLMAQSAIAWDQLRLWGLNTLKFGAGLVAVLGVLGWAALWKKSREEAWLCAACYGLVFVSAVLVNRTEADVRWLADIFVLPGQALLAVLLPLGLARRRHFLLPWALALLLAALHYGGLNRSGDYSAWDYGRNLLASIPKGAVYAAEGDYHFMPLLYEQVVRGRRADAEALVTPLLGDAWYKARLAKRRKDLPPQGGGPAATQVLQLMSGGGAERCFSSYHPLLDEAKLPRAARQRGLLRQVGGGANRAMETLALRQDSRKKTEPLTAQLMPWYAVSLVNQGNELMKEGAFAAAAWSYQAALGIPASLPREGILGNLENARREGRAQAAGLLNKADQLARQGRPEAIALYRQAMDLGIQSAALWRNIGVLEHQAGHKAKALLAMEKALELAPGDKELMSYRDLMKANP